MIGSMRAPERRRFTVLLIALLLPSAALVGIAMRMLRQERELSQRRAAQARRSLIVQAGRELEIGIDRITSEATPDSVVVFAAAVHDGVFALPWEGGARPRAAADSVLRRAHALEMQGDFTGAETIYQRATASSDTLMRDLAQLFRARNAARAGRRDQARALYQQLLQLPLSHTDEEGMPVALYAADWLRRHGIEPTKIEAALRSSARDPPRLSPVALYALRNHQHGPDSSRTEHEIAEAEQLSALRGEYPALLAAGAQQGGNIWLPYARGAWLVRADSTRVVVVRPAAILARSGVQVAQRSMAGAEPLGVAFPSVFAVATGAQAEQPNAGTLLLLIVALAVGLTAVSGFLLWRDVRRDLAMAELRTQFVNGISHELRTPLAAVRVNTDLLRMGIASGDAVQESLDTIAHETERLTRLIDNVLGFARLERGELDYRMQPIQPAALAAELQRKLGPLLQHDGFDLRLQVDPDLPTITADADALTQALMNLVANAVKFSGEARLIEVGFVRRQGQVVIRVTDRGAGISAVARPHVFEKFYRSPEARAAGVTGAGIGLALVADIARSHGGSVTVESELGRGSTFALSLPAAS